MPRAGERGAAAAGRDSRDGGGAALPRGLPHSDAAGPHVLAPTAPPSPGGRQPCAPGVSVSPGPIKKAYKFSEVV